MEAERPITRRWTAEELAVTVARLRPPSDDDVSITTDGERLDTFEKALAFFTELNRERQSSAQVVARQSRGR